MLHYDMLCYKNRSHERYLPWWFTWLESTKRNYIGMANSFLTLCFKNSTNNIKTVLEDVVFYPKYICIFNTFMSFRLYILCSQILNKIILANSIVHALVVLMVGNFFAINVESYHSSTQKNPWLLIFCKVKVQKCIMAKEPLPEILLQ